VAGSVIDTYAFVRATTMHEKCTTFQDVAECLQLSRDLSFLLAQKGKIPASYFGGRRRLNKGKIDPWVESQGAAAET